jgi:hypothetical protein
MAKPERPKKKPTGDYASGYCKTPEHSRFKPGQSGCPNGGKKSEATIGQLVLGEFETKTSVKLGGQVVTMKKKHALAKRIVADALGGDRHAQKLALTLCAQARAEQDGQKGPALTDDEVKLLLTMLKEDEDDGAD